MGEKTRFRFIERATTITTLQMITFLPVLAQNKTMRNLIGPNEFILNGAQNKRQKCEMKCDCVARIHPMMYNDINEIMSV